MQLFARYHGRIMQNVHTENKRTYPEPGGNQLLEKRKQQTRSWFLSRRRCIALPTCSTAQRSDLLDSPLAQRDI